MLRKYGVLLLVACLAFGLAQDYREAPSLTAQVSAGTLSPVQERLPENPLVIEPVESIGHYGGEWRSGVLGTSDTAWVTRTILYDPLVRWNPEWTAIIPNLAASWDVSEDASAYTFHLRRGVKWSDGTPFTSADILFWVQDVIGNSELNPAGQPSWLRVGGEDAVVTAPDAYTITFTFAAPSGLFLQQLASSNGIPMVNMPAEYAKTYHLAYNDAANRLAEQEGLPSWVELFNNKVGWINGPIQNPELPTINAWRLVTPLGQRLVYERNPYYWKVDPEGQQLPYLDRVVYPLFEDREVLLIRTLAGEVDFIARHINTLENRAVLFDNTERGNYRLIDTVPAFSNTAAIFVNLTHPDPVKRELFNNKLFRQALSVAINRQEIVDLVYVGQGEPHQAAPRPESEFYDEDFAKQYTEFDLEQARAWLDEAGYLLGSDGRRRGPDGQPISFSVDVSIGHGTGTDIMELILPYWRELGLEVESRTIERSLFDLRRDNNEFDVQIFVGVGGLDVVLRPSVYFPFDGESRQATPWRYWFQNPNDPRAEEPPAEVRRQMELYRQLQSTGDLGEQAALMREILDIAREGFYVMGISLDPFGYAIVRNNFRNVPDSFFDAFTLLSPAQNAPEQFYLETEGR